MTAGGLVIQRSAAVCIALPAPRREEITRKFDRPGVVDALSQNCGVVGQTGARPADRAPRRRLGGYDRDGAEPVERREIAAVGPRVAELNRALDQQKLTAGHTLARIETERRRAAQTTAAQFDTLLDTLRRAVESARADLDFIKNGIETWLLPTMARHEAELRRRGGWLGKLRRSAGWIRPTPPD
jgi:hypothetical protein